MGLRYYDGNISRFITADQFPGLVTEPITHNLYIYCNDDPINNIDPTGQLAIGSWAKKAGQAIKKAVQKTKQVVKKAVTTVKKVVKQTAKKAATTVKKVTTAVKKTVTAVKKTVKQVNKTATTTVKSAVKTVSNAAAKVTQQAKEVVADIETASSPRAPPTKILDAVQTGLDIVGLVPGVGEIADGTNALIYTLRGDKTNAALSAAACIPFAGWGAAGIKIVNKGAKALDKAGDAYDVGRGAREVVHGNSKLSTKVQHGYEIFENETGDVVKTGISGRLLNKNGTSTRANSQVNSFNNAVGYDKYGARVVEPNIPGRQSALDWEANNAMRLLEEGNSMSMHQRPHPWK